MKILELIFTLASGGGERFVVDLSNELSKTNEVALFTLLNDKKASEFRTFYRFAVSNQVRYKNLGLGSAYYVRFWWKLYRIIKNEKPDIVHLHLEKMPRFCLLAIILLHHRIRFVQTIHNDMSYYDDKFYRFFFKFFGRLHWISFVALSRTNYSDLLRKYPFVEASCIPNGRSPIEPTDSFPMVKKEIDSLRNNLDTKIFLHVARCCPQKNQELLIDSFNELVNQGYNAKLIILGSNFDSIDGKNLLSKAGHNIFYRGTKKNISDYMLNADIFVLSSLHEGLPITLLEASLAGIPAVCTPVCGAIDLIKNEQNGILSQSFKKNDFLFALKTAIEQYSKLKHNAESTRKDSCFTIERCATNYSNFFQNHCQR